MSKNRSDKLVSVLEERLPTFVERKESDHHQKELHERITAVHELFKDFVDQREQSANNIVEQLESGLDILNDGISDVHVQQLKGNQHLADIKDSSRSIEEASWETAKQVTLARYELEDLNETATTHLGLDAAGIAISAYQSHQLAKLIEATQEGSDDEISAIGDVEDSVDDMHGNMVDGHEGIIATQQETAEEIIRTIQDESSYIVEEIQSVSVEQRRGFQMVAYIFRNFDKNQERRHQKLSATILDTAKRRLALEADERYFFALQQFKAGNNPKATQELRKVFSAQSTHLPGLLLLGRISATEANWADAKDTYCNTARLSLLGGDIVAYEVAILALAEIERNLGNKKEADKLLKKAIDDWKEKVGEGRIKQDNAPVALYYEFYKQFLFGMAENIANTDFAQFVEHIKYDDYTHRPYEPEVKIDISSINNSICDRAKSFIDTWEAEVCRIMKELDAECFRYEVKLKRNDDQLSFDDSSLFAFGKFKKAFSEEVKKIDVWLKLAFGKDPYHSYFLDFEPLDKLQAFINEKERRLIGVISKRVCTGGWMSNGWFYDGCSGNFKYDVTVTTRCFDVIRKEIDENFHGNLDYNMADYEENYIDEFLSLSEHLRACCSWLVGNLERHFANGKLSFNKQKQLMKVVLSIYTDLSNLLQRFNEKNSKVQNKNDLINLTKIMTAIISVINTLILELDGHLGFLTGIEAKIKCPESRKENSPTSHNIF